MNSDDDIRRLLAADDAEPDAAMDARIRTAARIRAAASVAASSETAVSAAASAKSERRHRWYYPASGIGAAAALLLAVLIVQRAPDEASFRGEPALRGETHESPRANAAPHPAGPHPAGPQLAPENKSAAASYQDAAAESQLAREAPEAAALGQRALHDAQRTAPTPRAAAPPMPAAPPPAAFDAALEMDAPPVCAAPATPLRAGDIGLCLTAGLIEVHQSPPDDCPGPLALETGEGIVSASNTDSTVIIRIDGAPRWRVRCTDGVWQVAAP